MNEPLVSVIIPTYNRAEYLREAIQSVLDQTYTNFELLILDNCSPDHTPQVVAEFDDPRIKYLRHQSNIGVVANWTYGVHWAEGEFLSILGDDDIYEADFLIRRVKAVSDVVNIVVAFGRTQIMDSSGTAGNQIEPFDGSQTLLKGKDFFWEVLQGKCFVGAALYRTKAVKKVWGDALTGGMVCDLLLTILLAADPDHRGISISEADYLYRVHPQQDSTANRSKGVEQSMLLYNSYKLRSALQPYSDLLNKGIVFGFNHLGRYLWDRGDNSGARRCFAMELRVNPFRFVTWLRFVRSFIMRPEPISSSENR